MKKTVLRRYARLIARVGVNVQKGQCVIIYAQLDQPEFVTMLTDECYKAGAKEVSVEFSHGPLQKLHNRHASLKTLSTLKEWEKAKQEYMCDVVPCRIHLLSEDPDGLKGINIEKYTKWNQARRAAIKPYRQIREAKGEQWCIAAVPGKAWAKKVFPDLRPAAAVEALWDAILTASRVTEDPEKAWQEHNANLKAKCAYLNDLKLKRLHYTSKNGTDLTVGLMPQGMFCGGCDVHAGLTKAAFNANIPSEECFTSPKKGEAEGIVYSSKPLVWDGQIMDRFWIRFEKGKAVDCGAEVGEDLLKKLIAMDEGAAYLGECALVPWESPINKTGLLFYNTLFDENACCHLALGRGFYDTVRGGENMSQEEMHALGVNDSILHEDFMIGTEDLSIDGITENGDTVAIFRDGTWAF